MQDAILATTFVVAVETALIVGLVRNGFRRRAVQRRLETRLRFERRLSELSVTLAATAPDQIDDALDGVIPRVGVTLGIEWLWRWEADHPDDASWQVPRGRAGEPVRLSDTASLPPTLGARLRAAGVTACSALAVPLMSADAVSGAVFAVTSDPAAAWTEQEGELQVLAAVVSAVLQRKRAEIALEGSDRLKGAILDSLPAHVAVVDARGVIIAVNDSWDGFGGKSGLP